MEKQIFTTPDGLTLIADVAGPPDAQPLLFLHGGGQTRQSWGRAIAEAAESGYRALTVDLRGHGESSWSPDGRYEIDIFADDIRGIIATLDRTPVIVGASLGGLTGMIVAATPPPALSGLILVDIAVRIDHSGTDEIARFMNSAPDGFASLDEAADAVAAYLPHRPRPKDTSGLMRNLRLKADGRYHWHWDPAFIRRPLDEGMPDPAMFEHAARAIRVPTLLIRGGRSRVLTDEGARDFAALVPHAEIATVAGADHMVAGDANDDFNAAVFRFLATHAPANLPAPGE